MLTPQNIREKQFERAVLNGYASSSVDEFMEEIAVEYAALCKEISTQRKKMKVLVDEIEKYRASDSAMRMALLQAQKTCDELTAAAQKTAQSTIEAAQNEADALLTKAKTDGQAILDSAQQQYDEIVGGISAKADQEEARLAEAKRSSAQFIENMCKLCTRQLQYFEAFSSAVPLAGADEPTTADPAEPAAPSVAEVSAPVVAAEEPEVPETTPEAAPSAPVAPVAEPETPAEKEPEVPEEAPEEPEVSEATPEAASSAPAEDMDSLSNFMNTYLSAKDEPAPETEADDATKRFNFDDLNGLNFGR